MNASFLMGVAAMDRSISMDLAVAMESLAGKPIKVPLPNGRTVDITTKEGANALLKEDSSFDYLSSTLEEIRKLRKKKNLNGARRKKLEELYQSMESIAGKADVNVFRERIPESEIQNWLNYFIDEIKSFTKKPKWINFGNLESNDFRVLCSCYPMFERHVVPGSLAFKGEFFQVLAKFLKATRNSPFPLVCGSVGQISLHAFRTTTVFNSWPVEKIFEKFEASGLLEQILRCYIVPDVMASDANHMALCLLLEELTSCTRILTRKFKSGEPCGETLKAILDGREGSHAYLQPRVKATLKGLARIAETMDPTEFTARLASGACSFCSKKGDPELVSCGQCRFVFYCSKDCQRADWKSHKCYCRKMTIAEQDRTFSLHVATSKFMDQNRDAVLGEMDRICAREGLKPRDLVVRINFMPDENGDIPALDGRQSFFVLPIRSLLAAELPYGETSTDLQRSWQEDLIENLEKAQRKSTSGILVVSHAARIYIDTVCLEEYRQPGSSTIDIHLKLGTYWSSNRLSAFHNYPDLCTIDPEFTVDSTVELL